MSNEKMREAFADAFAKEVQNDQLTVLAMWSDEDGAFLNAEMQVGWNMWQAATAATQRDAMAVAEAVYHKTFWSCREGDGEVDLAAIVEAVPATRPEPVTWGAPKTVKHLIQQLQTMEPDMPVHGAIFVEEDGKRVPMIRPLSLSLERVDGRWIKRGDESIPYQLVAWTEEQPASAQQQGEPVAWRYKYAVHVKSKWPDDQENWNYAYSKDCKGLPPPEYFASREDMVCWQAIYTAPPAPECSVPDGWREMMQTAIDSLKWYANAGHVETLSGKLDWPAEREKLKSQGFRFECEMLDGEEVFVEYGERAAEAVEKLRAMLAATQKGGA